MSSPTEQKYKIIPDPTGVIKHLLDGLKPMCWSPDKRERIRGIMDAFPDGFTRIELKKWYDMKGSRGATDNIWVTGKTNASIFPADWKSFNDTYMSSRYFIEI